MAGRQAKNSTHYTAPSMYKSVQENFVYSCLLLTDSGVLEAFIIGGKYNVGFRVDLQTLPESPSYRCLTCKVVKNHNDRNARCAWIN